MPAATVSSYLMDNSDQIGQMAGMVMSAMGIPLVGALLTKDKIRAARETAQYARVAAATQLQDIRDRVAAFRDQAPAFATPPAARTATIAEPPAQTPTGGFTEEGAGAAAPVNDRNEQNRRRQLEQQRRADAQRNAGEARQRTGKALRASGQAAEAGGRAAQVVGKGLKAGGRATMRAGASLTGTGYGAVVGVPLAAVGAVATGTGAVAEAGGKASVAAGKQAKRVGRSLQRSGERAAQQSAAKELVASAQDVVSLVSKFKHFTPAFTIVGILYVLGYLNYRLLFGNLLSGQLFQAEPLSKPLAVLTLFLDLFVFFLLLLLGIFFYAVILALTDPCELFRQIRVDSFMGRVINIGCKLSGN